MLVGEFYEVVGIGVFSWVVSSSGRPLTNLFLLDIVPAKAFMTPLLPATARFLFVPSCFKKPPIKSPGIWTGSLATLVLTPAENPPTFAGPVTGSAAITCSCFKTVANWT